MGVAEVAEVLGWTTSKVGTYADRGKLPKPLAHLRSGRIWRCDDIERFKASLNSHQ